MEESCLFRAGASGVVGALGGMGMGFFFGTLEGAHGGLQGDTFRQQLSHGVRATWRATWARSKSLAISFGGVGLVYAGTECALAKIRGRADIYNAIWAGMLSGAGFGLLALRKYPQPTARLAARHVLVNAAGFATFSVVMDVGMHHTMYSSTYDATHSFYGVPATYRQHVDPTLPWNTASDHRGSSPLQWVLHGDPAAAAAPTTKGGDGAITSPY